MQEFYGEADLERLIEWIEDMQNHFELHKVEEVQQVKIANDSLRSHACEWWQQLKTDKNRRGKDKIQTWEKMVIK